MDDTALIQFFTRPTHVYHRQYEALRAVVVERRKQASVAREFGFEPHSLRQLLYDFRHGLDARDVSAASPFFKRPNESHRP